MYVGVFAVKVAADAVIAERGLFARSLARRRTLFRAFCHLASLAHLPKLSINPRIKISFCAAVGAASHPSQEHGRVVVAGKDHLFAALVTLRASVIVWQLRVVLALGLGKFIHWPKSSLARRNQSTFDLILQNEPRSRQKLRTRLRLKCKTNFLPANPMFPHLEC